MLRYDQGVVKIKPKKKQKTKTKTKNQNKTKQKKFIYIKQVYFASTCPWIFKQLLNPGTYIYNAGRKNILVDLWVCRQSKCVIFNWHFESELIWPKSAWFWSIRLDSRYHNFLLLSIHFQLSFTPACLWLVESVNNLAIHSADTGFRFGILARANELLDEFYILWATDQIPSQNKS